MSRGLGRVERGILAYLEQWRGTRQADIDWNLAVLVQKLEVHPESVRRALKSLERKGLVELGWHSGWANYDDGYGWVKTGLPAGPTARLSVGESPTLTDVSPGESHAVDVGELVGLLTGVRE